MRFTDNASFCQSVTMALVKQLALAFLFTLVCRDERRAFTTGFVPNLASPSPKSAFRVAHTMIPRTSNPPTTTTTGLFLSSSNNPKKSGLEEGVKNKLVKESIAPWRSLRLFFYFALGSGAMIGGLITLSGTLAAMSGARPDLDLNTQVCYDRKIQRVLSEFLPNCESVYDNHWLLPDFCSRASMTRP